MEERTWKRGYKQTYTDRLLTEEEREFAADWKNYNCFFRYMGVHKLNQEEWYDILIIGYLQAVKKYFSIPQLQAYNFEAVLFRTLDTKRGNYWRDMNRQKNMPSGGIVSLDWEVENLERNGNKIASTSWIDRTQQTEGDAFDTFMLESILISLNEVQSRIFTMLLQGYTKMEICKELSINYRLLREQMEKIQKVVSNYLSM